MYRVAFISLGCAKNLVNTEQMMALCDAAGYQLQQEPDGADDAAGEPAAVSAENA